MSAIRLIQRLHQHRLWASQQLRHAAATLTDEQLRQRFSIGQGSVWQTLTHLMAAEYVWLEALRGNESPLLPGDRSDGLPGNQAAADAMTTFDELERRWKTLDADWADWLQRATDADLQRPVSKISTSSQAGRRTTVAAGDVLLHVCTHAQYTSAQLVNMLRQLGIRDLPDVMLISLARSESTADS